MFDYERQKNKSNKNCITERDLELLVQKVAMDIRNAVGNVHHTLKTKCKSRVTAVDAQ